MLTPCGAQNDGEPTTEIHIGYLVSTAKLRSPVVAS